jgi:hypothetical protein
MKKTFTFLLIGFLFVTGPLFSQYCMLPGQTPYAPQQPGITNFKLNTINRTSSNTENMSSVVVTTGQTTTLTAGQTYTISITHSEDSQNFPGARNNLRVWIDYNSNFSYTDAGETVLLKDLENPNTTYTATFTVPASTPSGTISLRATAKMSADAGHTLPTPCNNPNDPLGYHGEMEDYQLIISGNPGQAPTSNFLLTSTVCVTSVATVTNNSSGTPNPTYSWTASPSAGVTFSPNNTATNPTISFSSAGTRTITCIASNSLSSNSSNKVINVNNCTSVGITQYEFAEMLHVYPNPASSQINVVASLEAPYANLELVNYLGEIILKKQIAGNIAMLDVSTLNNGIYLLKIHLENNVITKPVIINH